MTATTMFAHGRQDVIYKRTDLDEVRACQLGVNLVKEPLDNLLVNS